MIVYRLLNCAAVGVLLSIGASASGQEAKWISLFDGKTMTGWERVGNEASIWQVKEGSLSGSGPPSMLGK